MPQTADPSFQWLLYATPAPGQSFTLNAVSTSLAQASTAFTGTIQIAKNPGGAANEALYDAAAGVYPTGADVTGSASGATGSYSLTWTKDGLTSSNTTLLMYALPHHVQSFDAATSQAQTTLRLQTTTKGIATAVAKDSWTLVESDLPIDMGFAPWTPTMRSVHSLSSAAVNVINNVSAIEVSQNMSAQTNLNSMYFSGKVGSTAVG